MLVRNKRLQLTHFSDHGRLRRMMSQIAVGPKHQRAPAEPLEGDTLNVGEGWTHPQSDKPHF